MLLIVFIHDESSGRLHAEIITGSQYCWEHSWRRRLLLRICLRLCDHATTIVVSPGCSIVILLGDLLLLLLLLNWWLLSLHHGNCRRLLLMMALLIVLRGRRPHNVLMVGVGRCVAHFDFLHYLLWLLDLLRLYCWDSNKLRIVNIDTNRWYRVGGIGDASCSMKLLSELITVQILAKRDIVFGELVPLLGRDSN